MANPVIYVDTIATLINMDNSQGDIVMVEEIDPLTGNSQINITGGNPFVYQRGGIANSIPTGYGTIYPALGYDYGANAGPIWIMMFDGPMNVQWFGAVGDGQTDDTLSFQKAIDTGYPIIYIPATDKGYCLATINIFQASVNIFGDNKVRSRIYPLKDGISIFKISFPFVEVKYLEFDGNGKKDVVAIELYWDETMTYGNVSTLSDCYFDNLYKGIFNNSNNAHSPKQGQSQSGEHDIRTCRFNQCLYGIDSNGGFTASDIHQFCFFTLCKTAIRLTFGGKNNETEGVTITDSIIFQCGDSKSQMPAVDIRVSYTYIINCTIDHSKHHAVWLRLSQFSKIINCWLASPEADDGISTLKIEDQCNDLFVNNCNINDSRHYGIEIKSNLPSKSLNITISNSSFYPNDITKAQGFIYIKEALNVRVQSCNFYFDDPNNLNPNWKTIFIDGKSDLILDTCYLTPYKLPVVKGYNQIDVRLINCYNMPTSKVGIAVIPTPTSPNIYSHVDFAHGLTVLPGQFIAVVATNSSSFEAITAGITPSGDEIRLGRDANGTIPLYANYRADVYNTF